MKRLLGLMLALTMALTLFGCAGGPAETPAPQDAVAPAETEKPGEASAPEAEVPELRWSYALRREETRDEFKNDEGVLMASTHYVLPVLAAECEDDPAGQEPPRKMARVCAAFNDAVSMLAQGFDTIDSLARDAQVQYSEMDPEYREIFAPYEYETDIVSERQSGDLLEVMLSYYGYWGGAHGGSGYANLHFDLAAGGIFTLEDLTDEPVALREAMASEILEQIYTSDEARWYSPDFDETVQAKENYNFSLDEKNLIVYFEQYEIAPYDMGILEFEIPYEKLSRFLNERGRRLLDLPPETLALGDFYDAEEMWNWFELGAPMDYNERRSVTWTLPDGTSYEVDCFPFAGRGVTTMDALRALLRTRFSDELVEQKLAGSEIFREIDGVLYVIPADRGANMYVESVDYRAELNADGGGGRIVATIQWRDYDEQKESWVLTETTQAEFPFEQTESGARFTAFHSIY